MTTPALAGLIRAWKGEAVLSRFDAATGTWIFIALHSSRLGPPVGGCRMKTYPTPADALRDAMRLAEGMTFKWAAHGMKCGGGKAVLAVPRPLHGEKRRGLLMRFAGILNLLHGGFATGRDLGTTDDDMRILAGVSRWVHGVDRETGVVRDPGPYTARGVLAAIHATCRRVVPAGNLAGSVILIQGAGAVGAPLARLLAEQGARLLVSDVVADRAAALAGELGASIVAPEAVYDTPCDIYSPCAVGATLNAGTISRLQCKGVAGSANNQLAEEEDADRLHDRGILYAPDYLANGGGARVFWSIHRGMTDESELMGLADGIGDALDDLYREATEHDESPARTSRRRVEAALELRE